MPVTARRATLDDLEAVAPLFADYRTFYSQVPDLGTATRFLHERLVRDESVIFLAELDGRPAGFTQLYPRFSSVRAQRTFILNDLFVDAWARRKGVAQALLSAVVTFGREAGAIRLELETMPDNHAAQALYRAEGWQPNDSTLRFQLPLANTWSDDP